MTPRANQESGLLAVRRMVEKRFGLLFPDPQLPVLEERLKRLQPLLGVRSLADVQRAVLEHPARLAPQVIAALTVGETYFMRNRAQFEALRHRILPHLARHLPPGKALTIWSAGCATGEEPYSLAMWIREHAVQFWPDRLRILGTDLNAEFLARAARGCFKSHSFRQMERSWQKRYFRPQGELLAIDPSLRQRVGFIQHNLVSGQLPAGLAPGQVDLLFCRNVFIYFSARTAARVLTLFHQALKPDGVLVLGHAETLQPLKRWRTEYHPGTFYYLPPLQTSREVLVSPGTAIADRPRRTDPAPRIPAEPTPAPEIKVPGNMPVEILLETARHAANAGQLEDARRLLNTLLDRDKTCTEGHLLSAMVAEQLGDWEGARRALKKSLFLDRHLVLGHYLLAVMDERQGNLSEACRHYRTVSQLLRHAGSTELAYANGIPASRLLELSEARATELSNT